MTRRRARAVAVLVAAVGIGCCSATTVHSLAAWNDAAVMTTTISTSASDCSTSGVFAQSAQSALLAGTVQGTPVGTVAGLTGTTVGPAVGALSSTASVSVDVVGTSPPIGGTAAPFTMTPHATFTQTASSTGRGSASAGVSGSTAFGTIDVSGLLARSSAGAAALPGLTGVALDVGPVTASATFDGCRRAWGATQASALTRTATVGALVLRLGDAAATGFASDAASASGTAVRATTGAAASSASGIGSAASTGFDAAVAAALSGLGAAGYSRSPSATATVTTSGSAVAAVASGSITDPSGVATMNAATGALSTDLGVLSGGLTAPAANTAVLSGTATGTLASAVTATFGAQSAALQSAWAAMRDGATTRVQAADVLSTTTLGVTTQVATVAVDQTQTAAAWAAGTAPVPTVTVTPIGAGVPPPGLAAAVAAQLAGGYLPQVGQAVQSAFVTPATNAVSTGASTLSAAVSTRSQAAQAQIAALAGVLVPTLAVEPDQSPGPVGWTGATSPGQWVVSALRVRVLAGGATLGDLSVGDVAVGPVAPPGS